MPGIQAQQGQASSINANAPGVVTPLDALAATAPLHGILHLAIPVPPEYVALGVMEVTPADEINHDPGSPRRIWKIAAGMVLRVWRCKPIPNLISIL